MVVLAVGFLAVDEQWDNWAPIPSTETAQAAPVTAPAEVKPAETKPVEIRPIEFAQTAITQAEPSRPIVTAPPAEKAAPAAAAPPAQMSAQSSAPVAVAPAEPKPEPKPAPVVTAPPAEKPTPAVVAPAEPKPESKPAPVVSAPSVEKPARAVSLPPADTAPMPPEKPAIAETKKGVIAAKTLFAAERLPSLGKAMAIGYYPRGCLQGGVALPVTGPTWQVMRVSRNRMWGHPELVKFLEHFAPRAAKATGWHGILIGDMAQPRGGPLPFGHMSHQIGLDVDIWFMPMPGHVLSKTEREKISAINLVADDWKHINPKTWQPQADVAFIRTAAEQPEVERVLVNAAIKKEICRMQGDKHPVWMDKLRPWYGHNDHIHVRLKCPADSPSCRKQPPVPNDAACGKALDYWLSDKVLHPKRAPETGKPRKPPKPITLADLPPACKTVLAEPAREPSN
jgi:penicillin-insensitive murein endopeptidase